jgi:glutamate/tyrosine decarboxylase-like PLP-dependent enzyme
MAERDLDLTALFHDVAERAAAFRNAIGDGPQRPLSDYRTMTGVFAGKTPETGLAADAVIAELAKKAAAGLHAMTGPRFFGWVIGASHPVGVAADWLTSAWGQNAGNHQAAPAAAAAESVAASWLLDILGLPEECSVGFVTGATVANLVCLAAARSEVLRRVGWDVESTGLFGAPPIHIVIGNDAHTTVFAALQVLGLGHDRVIRVPTDEAGRVTVDGFAAALAGCDGPIITVLQAGQINTGAFDPFADLVRLAHARGAWVHVDGAFGLWARACPPLVDLARGVEEADSWATDGHKWLQTPYDCGYAIVRDARAHRRAMTASASYLPETAEGERDPSHFVPELSRRGRGFATWAMIRHLGRDGIANMVERHCQLARELAENLRAEAGIAVLNEVCLNQVIVRFGTDRAAEEADALTQAVIARVQADGVCFVGGARWRNQWVMRISVIGWPTTTQDTGASAAAIRAAWRACATA